MFEEAVQAAKRMFRVSRRQQQFPKLPFVFGGYDWPERKLTLLQKLGQQEVLSEANELYSDLLRWLAVRGERGKAPISDELRIKTQACLSLFAKQNIRLVGRTTAHESTYRLLARRKYNGPYLPMRSLNPQTDDLISIFNTTALSLDNPVYKDLQAKYGNDLARDIDYVLARFDPVKVLDQLEEGQPLTSFQREQMHLLHLHINNIGVSYDEALVAVKHNQRLLVLNEKGDELDGETESNIHIVLVRKMTTLSKCSWLARHFPQNRWILSDIDFLLEASSLSP